MQQSAESFKQFLIINAVKLDIVAKMTHKNKKNEWLFCC